MAVVYAKGETRYLGYKEIYIYGDKFVERIECKDRAFAMFVQDMIDKAEGYTANAYYPPAKTMLQAKATLERLFEHYYDVHVDGDIGVIPFDPDPDIIY